MSLRARLSMKITACDVLTGEPAQETTLVPGEFFAVAGRQAWPLRVRR